MTRDYKLAPIVLFVYNRPTHTQRTISGLLENPEAKDSTLYIFADGPKPNASDKDQENIEKVRDFIHSINGFNNIFIEESEQNRGLANSTIYGCTKIINKYGRMIMLEDDDIPSKYFLSYVNRCLDKYEKDKNIWCISGYVDGMITPPRKNADDLFLVNRPSSWGFGTWKRCWDKVIWDIDTLKGLFSHQDVISGFNSWAGQDSSGIIFSLFAGKSSSWSIRYNFAAYLNDSKTILPNSTLIENTGCDGTGTHCGKIDFHVIKMDHPVNIPNVIKYDAIRNKELYRSFIPKTIGGKIRQFCNNHLYLKSLLTIIDSVNCFKNKNS